MAEKRMFTGKITESDAFLDMPLTSQCLYFHLCMYADDEGFVKNPKRIQRMIGATDDDLRVLIGKNFLIIYETGVIVIKHWKMHNAIRKDRIHDSEYIEEKSMLYIKENGAYTLDPAQGVPLLSTKCLTDDGQVTAECQPNVGIDKIRLDKDSIDNNNIVELTHQIIDYLNQKCGTKYKASTANTKKHISARLNDGYTYEDFVKVIDKKYSEWKGTQMEQYLRPDTLFGTKFEGYLNQNIVKNKPVTSQFHQMEKSNYDFGDLEKKLLNL